MEIVFTLLIIGLTVVNGWTDAPSAIAGCVCTRSLKPKHALIMAGLCNLAGAVIMALWHPGVAETLYGIASFGSDPRSALLSLCSAVLAVIAWAALASLWGIPTSESHALISGMSGAAIASSGSFGAISAEQWRTVLTGILISTVPVLVLSALLYKISSRIFSEQDRRGTIRYFKRVQLFSAASSAFLHGAQDSQKFIGVYLLGLSFLGKHSVEGEFSIPFYVTLICSLAMTLGTMMGGTRIIKKVGSEMTHLDALGSSAADTASSALLSVCSFLGIPTATTQAKTCAMMGVGLCKKNGTNPRVVAQMLGGWFLTFPVCALLGFGLSMLTHMLFF